MESEDVLTAGAHEGWVCTAHAQGEEFKEVNVLGKMSPDSCPEGPFLE